MPSSEIIEEVSKPEFYTRVSYLSLSTAQAVASEDPATANHDNRVAYSARIFRGDEDALMLAMHVATNPTIAATIETSGGAAVTDGDISFTLSSIWDARANSFAAASTP